MDKLGPVRAVIIQKDDDCDFLRKYMERNLLRDTENTKKKTPQVNLKQNKIDNWSISGLRVEKSKNALMSHTSQPFSV